MDAAPVWVRNACLFGASADRKFRKHAREIYRAAEENGTIISRGDKGAMRTYISGIVSDIYKGNPSFFEWNGVSGNGYVKGNSIVLVRENGEFLTHLIKTQNMSSLLKRELG